MLSAVLLFSLFSNASAFDRIDSKDACRQSIMAKQENRPANKSLYQGNELVENLVDLGRDALRNIEEMSDKNLTDAHLDIRPWSDYYWPIASGQIAARYADSAMPDGNWREAYQYFTDHPVAEYLNSSRADLLSPAEKYSLVSGDKKQLLAAKMWQDGRQYVDESGSVESWMGLCHGWAAASLMLAPPSQKVTYQGVNFFPSDIKALGTLLWANGKFATRFIGGRCETKDPKRDEFGRIKDQDCFDINPGTWHMAIVNQIGISKRGFVMDATFDYQVWNQPVYRYNYQYFNPQTGKKSDDLKNALMPYKNLTHDKYAHYRKNNVVYIVGIQMQVDYVAEVNPNHEEGPFISQLNSAQYRYDLELDEHKNIIGGEWYSENHPDFLWVPSQSAKVQTPGDAASNARAGLPLASVVEKLFELSK